MRSISIFYCVSQGVEFIKAKRNAEQYLLDVPSTDHMIKIVDKKSFKNQIRNVFITTTENMLSYLRKGILDISTIKTQNPVSFDF